MLYAIDWKTETVFVLTSLPDWTDVPSCEFRLTRDRQAGLTVREARRGYSMTLLCKLTYSITATGGELRELQGGLRALTTERVILPLSLFTVPWRDRAAASVQGGLMMVWKDDWSKFEFYAAGDPEPAWPEDGDNWAPALMGFLNQSSPQFLSADAAVFKVEFIESSPAAYALAPQPSDFTPGPLPAGYTAAPLLLPCIPDFTRISEELRVNITRDQIGFTREEVDTFYNHEVFRGQSADYTLTDDWPATLLRFFQDHMGPGDSFWALSWLNAARLVGDIAAADTSLNVEDTFSVIPGDYLAIFADTFAVGKVIEVGLNTIKLDSAVGSDIPYDVGCVFPLNLVRLDDPTITISWPAGHVATVSLAVTELRPEYTIAPDEILGQTIGRLPTRVVLFEFNRDLGNGTILTDRFTSFEKDLPWAAQMWLSGPYSHGDVTRSLNLEDDDLDLTSFVIAGNPMLEDAALRSEAPLSVIIRWADYDGTTLSNVVVMFSGEVTAPARDGNKITAKAVAGPSLLDVQLPRMIHGVQCGHIAGSNVAGTFLISAGCTLLRSDWKFTAAVTGSPLGDYPYALTLHGLARVSGAAPNYFADWFALGVLEWGAGAAVQRRYVLHSTNPVAGSLVVTLNRWFLGAGPQPNDVVTLYPGCDGQVTTCKGYDAVTNPAGKFNNYVLNYGGEPFTPIGNPSLVKLNTPPTAGGKK